MSSGYGTTTQSRNRHVFSRGSAVDCAANPVRGYAVDCAANPLRGYAVDCAACRPAMNPNVIPGPSVPPAPPYTPAVGEDIALLQM